MLRVEHLSKSFDGPPSANGQPPARLDVLRDVSLTLKPGEFLVVGPGDQADNEYLIGSRFLVHSASGERSETLLFITPQPFQSPSAQRRP